MLPQVQPITDQPQKFRCLEDRLLQALYTVEGPVSLSDLAKPIAITPNAAMSIVHRIKHTYPQYLLIQDEELVDRCELCSVQTEATHVNQFLEEGGFTKINEQEFLLYYQVEVRKEKRRNQLRNLQTKIRNERWSIGIALLIGLGIIGVTYLHRRNEM